MIKISACVITKNESKNIARWVGNMRGIADEIIVVDTGSDDDTVKIAESMGAQIYHFAWIDDFAAAKNFALEQATGNWIFFLDADEYFDRESLAKVREVICEVEPRPEIAGVACRKINIDADNGNRFGSALVEIRIFRNSSKYRYRGCVHERLTIPADKKVELSTKLTIYHTGYSANIVKDKLRRNLRLMDKRIAEKNGKIEALDEQYYMDIYYGLDDREKAAAFAEKIAARSDATPDLLARAHETLISIYVDGDYPEDEVMKVIERGKCACPDRADFSLMQGLYLYRLRDYINAEKYILEGLATRAKSNDYAVSTADNAERLLPSVEWCLGYLDEMRGQIENALEHYVGGLKHFPYHRGLIVGLCRLLTDAGVDETEIIRTLNSLYSTEDSSFLAETLAKWKIGRVYLYYADKAGLKIPTEIRYLAANHLAAAAETMADNLRRSFLMGAWAIKHGAKNAVSIEGLLPDNYKKLLSSKVPTDGLGETLTRAERELARTKVK